MGVQPELAFDGECGIDGCDEPCSWDMVAIAVDEEVYCSPECALAAVEEAETLPQTITLHDPQMAVSRGWFDGLDDGDVDIVCELNDPGEWEVEKAIKEAGGLHTPPFRIDPSEFE